MCLTGFILIFSVYSKEKNIYHRFFSKWPEVYEMSKSYASNTNIKNYLIVFSEQFQMFCKLNGIIHITAAPYHPSTNDAAENSGKSLKLGLNSVT